MSERAERPVEGQCVEVPYPFVLEEIETFDADGPCKAMSWRPGVRFHSRTVRTWGDAHDVVDSLADGIGKQIITVISTHKPGRYPLRVFYTRQWQAPNGKVFGKSACRVSSITAFRSLVRGYRHDFNLAESEGRS